MVQKRLLIVALNWPEPRATAAGQRMMQLISFFLEQDYQVTFACTAAEPPEARRGEWNKISTIRILVNDAGFDERIQELVPDIVMFDRFISEEQFGWRVARYVPSALRILDTEDLHSLRAARKLALKSGIPFTDNLWLQNPMASREVAAIFRCDLSLVISGYEMEILLKQVPVPSHILLYLPLWAERISLSDRRKWPSYQQRTDFICIGNGKHAPNTDAVKWLFEAIWPFIRKALPGSTVHIYGAYLPESIQQLNNPETGFLVHGRVADSREVMKRCRINLAPLRFGAGLKGKLLEGMKCGTPGVTTAIGIEGLTEPGSGAAIIADLPQEFAEEAVRLYLDEREWNAVQDAGVELINAGYGSKEHTARLTDTLKVIRDDLPAHRARNFIGSMLHHHTLASAEYLSRWITAKNRLASHSDTSDNGD